jgi:hypothetical protein
MPEPAPKAAMKFGAGAATAVVAVVEVAEVVVAMVFLFVNHEIGAWV